jgi:formylmethanofuran dehydrogenase subunit C
VSGAVVLSLRADPDGTLELDGVTPEALAPLSEAAIARLPVWCGRVRAELGDFFVVRGSGAHALRLEGDLTRVDAIGSDMAAGELAIEGPAGRRVAAGLRGGIVRVRGNVADDAGMAMAGGVLHVAGSAGDRLGGPLPGASRGMTGGEIVVEGSAGVDAAARCRRGLVVVGGDVGDDAGRAMIAGTLVVLGRAGGQPMMGNKRGSLVAAGGVEVPANYRYACTFEPPHVALLMVHLRRVYRLLVDDAVLRGPYRRYCGDLGGLGKGEILALAARD